MILGTSSVHNMEHGVIPDHHVHPWGLVVEGFWGDPALHDLPLVWSWEDLNHLGTHGLLRIGPLTSPELARGCGDSPVPHTLSLSVRSPDLQEILLDLLGGHGDPPEWFYRTSWEVLRDFPEDSSRPLRCPRVGMLQQREYLK